MARRRVWAATDVGLVRKTNEDCFGLAAIISGGRSREEWQGELSTTTGVGWAVIADGMGGHEAGEIASRAVVESLHRRADLLVSEAGIVAALNEANATIFESIAGGRGRPGMGSTIVGVVFVCQECFAFNIGDSRLYLKRKSELFQMSTDDTMGASRSGTHSRSHALTQSLGGTRDPVPLFPHLRAWRPIRDDILILGSDGLSDMLSEDDILANLVLDGHPARGLVEAALRAGGRDNVTAIVIGQEVD
ncbi:MAG: hypothetical protein BGP06_19690 [Rhizobiales bacterium 65-9]|nr:serine/threonine-protein phosphatase [Hyphomicrobiales bacterium]OJY37074.1 MAG: hypothetical protein BGP06_19690 [Rhizobiales bacterium 65-9]